MKFYETIRFKFTWNIHNISNFAFNFRSKKSWKGVLLFKKLLKFLLSKDEDQSSANSKAKPEELEESEVKEETIDPEIKTIKPKKRTVKDEIIDGQVNTDNI